MGNVPFQRTSFAAIKHKLPKDSWVYEINTQRGEFEDRIVLYHQGDLRLPQLDLDDPLRPPGRSADKASESVLVVVDGDLQVDGLIGNRSDSGTAGLHVLGDLRARNMVVGGQEIYVTGNVTVDELFWGHYNHGMLTVKGGASARVFVETDQYYVAVAGGIETRRHIKDIDNEAFASALEEVFVPDCIFYYEFNNEQRADLDRDGVLDRLEARQSVILLT
jgi:formylmethanofuran dehydrogenase subunit C